MLKPFLTANWRYLAMLNFAVDPKLLASHVPVGTELDFFNGQTYVSVVGFLFYHTVILGLPIPKHRNFEEVNLRFYVRKKSADTWRRGVVFIRELVPKIAIAVTARVFYGEPYLALPMRSDVEEKDGIVSAKYEWRRGTKWERIAMTAHGEAQNIPQASHEEFITEHYWGYTARGERTSEYRVEHPRWKMWPADSFEFKADVAMLYGEKFVEVLSAKPISAFIADGSFVSVFARSE
ncbi:MAG: YqjF family protein [Chthoniobacterales bacterium]